MVLFWYCYGYIIVSLPFLAKIFMFCILFYIWNTTSGIKAPSLTKNCGLKFFRVETYSDVLKLQRYVITRINLHGRGVIHRKYKLYLSAHMLATLVTLVGTPSSGSASDNTCIHIDLDLLKPSIDKLIGHLTVIVPLRTTLRKILSSTWVVG
jgi:hypothetical protein